MIISQPAHQFCSNAGAGSVWNIAAAPLQQPLPYVLFCFSHSRSHCFYGFPCSLTCFLHFLYCLGDLSFQSLRLICRHWCSHWNYCKQTHDMRSTNTHHCLSPLILHFIVLSKEGHGSVCRICTGHQHFPIKSLNSASKMLSDLSAEPQHWLPGPRSPGWRCPLWWRWLCWSRPMWTPPSTHRPLRQHCPRLPPAASCRPCRGGRSWRGSADCQPGWTLDHIYHRGTVSPLRQDRVKSSTED